MTETPLSSIADAAAESMGVELFTVTLIAPEGDEISRVYSTNTDVYPVGGRKRLDPSGTSPIWYKQVLTEQRPYFGPTAKDIEEFFVDHDVIASLGLEAIINTPVVHDGTTIGSINFLAPAGVLSEDSVARALALTERALPVVIKASREHFGAPGSPTP